MSVFTRPPRRCPGLGVCQRISTGAGMKRANDPAAQRRRTARTEAAVRCSRELYAARAPDTISSRHLLYNLDKVQRRKGKHYRSRTTKPSPQFKGVDLIVRPHQQPDDGPMRDHDKIRVTSSLQLTQQGLAESLECLGSRLFADHPPIKLPKQCGVHPFVLIGRHHGQNWPIKLPQAFDDRERRTEFTCNDLTRPGCLRLGATHEFERNEPLEKIRQPTCLSLSFVSQPPLPWGHRRIEYRLRVLDQDDA